MILFVITGLALAVATWGALQGGAWVVAAWALYPVALVYGGFLYFIWRTARKLKSPPMAVRGTATITELRTTNHRMGDRPVIDLSLHIEPEGGTAYDLNHREGVLEVVAGQVDLRPGSKVPVYIDPYKREKIEIDWDAVLQTPRGAEQ